MLENKILSKEEILKLPVDKLNLTARTTNCLKAEDLYLIQDVIDYGAGNLLTIQNFGKKGLLEIKDALKEIKLTLPRVGIRKIKEPIKINLSLTIAEATLINEGFFELINYLQSHEKSRLLERYIDFESHRTLMVAIDKKIEAATKMEKMHDDTLDRYFKD